MADKLSITIALQGGAEIKRQLEGIGAAGQKAFEDISQAAEQVGGFKNLKPEEVTAKLKQMGIVGEEALKKITDAVQAATRLETLVGAVRAAETAFLALKVAVGGVVGAAAAIAPVLIKMMDSAAEAIHKADTEAIKLGLSIEKFDQLRIGFERMGASSAAIGDGIASVNKAIEKLDVERVQKAFKTLQEGATRGFGGIGTDELNLLIEQAGKVGPAADLARASLEKLGATLIPAQSALERLGIATGDASAIIPQFVEKMRQLPDTSQRTADAIAVLGSKLGVEFIQALRTGGVAVDQFKASLTGLTQDQANAANALEQEWNRLGSSWERLKTTVGATLLVNVPTNLISTLEAINSLLKPETWSSWGSAAVDAIVGILAKIGELEVALAHTTLPTGAGGQTFETGAAPGFAAGGLLGGIGSGISDSNLAWVSRGEHIMPASVVARPGVLSLLEALRVGGVMPRFAAGGMVGGMGHLGTVDLRTDHGSVTLMASGSAVDQLSRLAVTKRMTSTGRKPGFIG